MGRLSARSNPTGLQEIERARVKISVSEIGHQRSFALDRLDLEGKRTAASMEVVVIARAGNTSARYPMGTVGNPEKARQKLDGLDSFHPLRFRLLIHPSGDPKIAASLENIRPFDDANGESLLPMVPADLGERLWKLVIDEGGPELHFNSAVFPNAAGAESYVPFTSLVLPEALFQVMHRLAEDPGLLEDEDDVWFSWGSWIRALGAELPTLDDDDEAVANWCNNVVDRFCTRIGVATRMRQELNRSMGND